MNSHRSLSTCIVSGSSIYMCMYLYAGIVEEIEIMEGEVAGQTNTESNGNDESKEDISNLCDGIKNNVNISTESQRLGSVGSEGSDQTDTTVTRVRRKDWETLSSDERSTDTLNDLSSQGESSPEKPQSFGHNVTYSGAVSDSSNDAQQSNGDIVQRPGSLSLPRPLQHKEKRRSRSDAHDRMFRSVTGAVDIPEKDSELRNIEETMLSKSMPHGTIINRQGDMFEFVADDLQEKIRRSSPLTKTGTG